MRTFNIKCCFVIEVAVMREEKRLNMECASGIIAQGINLAKVLEPIEWFFASIFVHAYALSLQNTDMECIYIKMNVSIVGKNY